MTRTDIQHAAANAPPFAKVSRRYLEAIQAAEQHLPEAKRSKATGELGSSFPGSLAAIGFAVVTATSMLLWIGLSLLNLANHLAH